MKAVKIIGCAIGLLLLSGFSMGLEPATRASQTSIIKEVKFQWQQFSNSLSGGMMQPHRIHF